MLIFRLITHIIISFICAASYAQNVKKAFKYGFCGHPLTQVAYAKNIDLQIRLIKNSKSSFYRIDIPVDSNGIVTNPSRFSELMQKFKKNKIKILPVLVFNNSVYNYKSSTESYSKGLLYGKNFAHLYKNQFDYYEVGNEEDNNLILPQRHGNTIADYDTSKAKIIIPYIKGVCEAIKREDFSAKLVINHTWVHWGFLELLNKYSIKYDIIGCHWYSEMGDFKDAYGEFGNIIIDLHKRFNKQIWITEFNVRNGSSQLLKKADDDWFLRNLNFIRHNKYVDAVFIYELLDQPAFLNKQSPYYNPGEAKYGLWEWEEKGAKATPKPLFNRYQSFIKKNP